MVFFFYRQAVGTNLIAKFDHYLRLDGQLIGGRSFSLFPGESFYQSKNISYVYCGAVLFCLYWGVGTLEPSSNSVNVLAQAESKSKNDKELPKLLDRAVVADLTLVSNEETKVSWNLMSQSRAVSELSQKAEVDKTFFVSNWINALPFEWQLK